MNGIELIAAERARQIEKEGWTPGHDDKHAAGEMAAAAACYAINAAGTLSMDSESEIDVSGEPPPPWPWDEEWWKPKDPLRDLVRSGALIAAEIDRLQRKP